MQLTQRQVQKYVKSTRKEKGEIISRYCELTKVSRNLASKRFRKIAKNPYPRALPVKKHKGKRRGCKAKYTSIHKAIIKKVWELSGEICGERLHPVIENYIQQLEVNDKLKYYGKRYIKESKTVSERTLKRIIAQFPKLLNKKKVKGKADIYKIIPIHAYFGENTNKPGYVEIDYVEHSGGNSSGTFAITGSYVDICLGWLTRASGLGKSLKSVGEIHDKNENKILHLVYEYHTDNAKPILHILLERKLNPGFKQERRIDYQISRSRPYHKEDNGHVEQKNGDKVRKLVGYHRYDTQEQITLLNQLYDIEDLISNFFLPSQKLIEKTKDDKGRTINKKYEKAKTAYQRLIEEDSIDRKIKKRAREIYNNLNLIKLREQSEKIKDKLFNNIISRKNNMI